MAFYVDTILFIVKQYEEEITYKLLSQKLIDSGYYWRFNVNVILRADSKTQMESLAIGVNNGIIKPDEARNELDRPIADGGDRLYANGNYIPLTLAGKQYGAVVDSEGGEE
ncbi:phage portal protein [Halalkalibacter wakoensis JCM 9140]|uniref:Phage portal protein n=1 Tax=Halalkalibacter wakoensis JCM 9140 TaxID=1236970 RepID=W4Q4Z9_9BACI|nr:phage portal protein [Halalkalibacter wakoensis JCM 9140]